MSGKNLSKTKMRKAADIDPEIIIGVIICVVLVILYAVLTISDSRKDYTEQDFNDVTFRVICKCDDGNYIAVCEDTGEVYKGGISAYKKIGEVVE